MMHPVFYVAAAASDDWWALYHCDSLEFFVVWSESTFIAVPQRKKTRKQNNDNNKSRPWTPTNGCTQAAQLLLCTERKWSLDKIGKERRLRMYLLKTLIEFPTS